MMGTSFKFLTRATDNASLGAFRVLFGLLMFAAVVRFAAKGWIREFYIEPTYFFTYEGFSWIHPWPVWGMYAHFVLLGVLALMIAAGVYYRAAVVLFFLGFTYAELIDKSTYLNHYYLVSVLAFLMALLPLDERFVWNPFRRHLPERLAAPAWVLYALRLQLGLVYFYAAVAKIHGDWLLRGLPLKFWLAARADLPVIGPWIAMPAAALAFSWFGFLFDLTVPFFLLNRKTRTYAFAVVVIFHAMTAVLFRIGMFPWIMIATATVFLSPDWPTKLFSRFARRERRSDRVESSPRRYGWVFATAVALHLIVQVLLPLRHWLYPGDVLWGEEGFRFSWRVMLTEKDGSVSYEVSDPLSGRRWEIDPKDYLKSYQLKQMSTQPDMIRQLARRIAEDFEAQGYPDVEVRANAMASLNGREVKPLIDPNLILAKGDL
ncbi:MAG TPA: HTTM domain-containing protein [bacterium]|nr:HTTM domain-containing protein [bacterium]